MSQTIVSVAGAVPLGKGSGIGRWAGRLDAAMGAVVEFLAMLLILVEIAILFSGVIARYVVHVPLVWTDELATILFLWLSMLRSEEHTSELQSLMRISYAVFCLNKKRQ